MKLSPASRFPLHKIFWWLLPLCGTGLMFFWSARNTTNVPKWDAYPIIADPLVKSLDGTLTFADLHSQVVDNRMLFPRLIHLALAHLTKWSIPAETAATVTLGGISVLMLAGLARRTWPQGGWCPWVTAVVTGTLWFSLSGYMIWTYGPFLCHAMVALLAVAQIWLFSLSVPVMRKIVLGCLLAFIAAESFIYGWLSWGLLGWQILGLWLNQTIRRREFLILIGVLSGVMALTCWWYFTNYTFAGKPGLAGRMLSDPMRYGNFFLQWLGSGLGNPWPAMAKPARVALQYPVAWWAGLGVLVLMILAGFLVFKNRGSRQSAWPWCGLVWWGVVGGILVTIGRADFSSEAAFWPRYQILVYAVYLGVGVVLCLHLQRLRSQWKWLGAAPLVPALIGWANGSVTGYAEMRADFYRSQAVHGALVMKDVAPDPVLLNQAFPDNFPAVQKTLNCLASRGYMHPGLVQKDSVQAAKIDRSSRFEGEISEGESTSDGNVSLTGWAVDKQRSGPVDTVVISVQPEGGEEVWWTVATKSKPANKQALKLKLRTANSRIGWDLGANETIQNLSRKPLPAGKLTFRAYALDVKTLVFHPLEGEYRRE